MTGYQPVNELKIEFKGSLTKISLKYIYINCENR